jgi:hypothetical protein
VAAQYWSKYAPTFRTPGVKLLQLAKRPKPCKEGKAYAEKVMSEMKDWEADGFSAKFCDEDGCLMAAYFAHRIALPDQAAPVSFRS